MNQWGEILIARLGESTSELPNESISDPTIVSTIIDQRAEDAVSAPIGESRNVSIDGSAHRQKLPGDESINARQNVRASQSISQ